MIKAEQLYAATNDGLDIIALHYPDAVEAARTNKPFKMRPNERTPSARIRKYTSKQGGYAVWKVTDFGGEGTAVGPIDIHMERCNLNFAEAVLDLASVFGVTDELNKSVNRPDIRKEPAAPDHEDGSQFWELDQDFTKEDCRTMGPGVTTEHLKAMHWHRAKFIARTKNRETTYIHSNENYPIYVRECWYNGEDGKPDRFYKIYKPKEPEKQWRFSYWPTSKKPQRYTNGLFELAAAWTAYNEAEEKAFNADPANEDKEYKPKKLPEAIICSGERDSMCAKALGYPPVWFNSETYRVSDEEYAQIMKYVEVLYNIPDIDTTGKIKGRELAMRFIDIHTIWLPDHLSTMRDNRGRPRKDFRDWREVYSKSVDFKKLLARAKPAKFWTVETDKHGNQKYRLQMERLLSFLNLKGYARLKDRTSGVIRMVHIVGNIVEEVTHADIRNFAFGWLYENGYSEAIRDKVLTSTYFTPTAMESLPVVDLDFTTFTQNSQWFHFPKYSFRVTSSGIERFDNKTSGIDRYVWKDSVIPHDIKVTPDMFTISHPDDSVKSEDFDIEIHDKTSKYFCYLINNSRIYWRKELETRWDNTQKKERDAYFADHRFDIEGEGLTEEEIKEQKRCLISKIFAIGYLLHRYKDPSRPWAPFVMDNIIGENDQCNGGSGKSFMISSLANLVRYEKISGRNPKVLENQFAFERVDRYTDIVLVDDCDEFLPFEQFYDVITSGMTINTKNVKSYTLSDQESPKFAFTTNYTPKKFDPSTTRRMLYVVTSDYYHAKGEDNDYLESRTISDDFRKNLFREDYSEQEWEADINFMLQCVRFYLSMRGTDAKIEPDIKNIMFRKYKRDMSENFSNWAEVYFAPEGDHLDTFLVKEDAFAAYKAFSGLNKTSMHGFKKSLVAFCYTCDWVAEFNPEEYCNSGSRILKRVENPTTHAKEQKEMIYLRSVKATESMGSKPGERQSQSPSIQTAFSFPPMPGGPKLPMDDSDNPMLPWNQ